VRGSHGSRRTIRCVARRQVDGRVPSSFPSQLSVCVPAPVTRLSGASEAKGGDRGKCGPAKHVPGADSAVAGSATDCSTGRLDLLNCVSSKPGAGHSCLFAKSAHLIVNHIQDAVGVTGPAAFGLFLAQIIIAINPTIAIPTTKKASAAASYSSQYLCTRMRSFSTEEWASTNLSTDN